MPVSDQLTRRTLIASAAVGFGVLATEAEAAAQRQPLKLTFDDQNNEKGIAGTVRTANTDFYEVKSYVVQSNFDQSTSKMPNAFTIFLLSEKDGMGGGRFWTNRTAEAIAAMTSLMDKAFASGQKVYYSYKCEQLSVGMGPLCVKAGTEGNIPIPRG